jgi:predicted nucleic-acid-binding protein
MIGLDTNVLVRYIMQDDPRQSPKATKIVESLEGVGSGYVALVSIVELVWVLSASYGLTRLQVQD